MGSPKGIKNIQGAGALDKTHFYVIVTKAHAPWKTIISHSFTQGAGAMEKYILSQNLFQGAVAM